MRFFPALLVSSALVLTAPLLPTEARADLSGSSGPAAAARSGPLAAQTQPDPDDPRNWQTSDQVRGEIARTLPRYLRASYSRTMRFRYSIAPRTYVLGYDERTARGPVRYFVVRMPWSKSATKLDYVGASHVSKREPMTTMVGRSSKTVAGINGDFFDIGDTDAPLGLGVARGQKIEHGIDFGWNSALYVPRQGQPDVGTVGMHARIKEHPKVSVTNYNSPQVKPGGIGVYDAKWGKAVGYRWTDGQKYDVRMVHVQGGKVVANRTKGFPGRGQVQGKYLIARGRSASQTLARIKVGSQLHVSSWAKGLPQMLITGNRTLVKDGKLEDVDDREMHPRTAVGIDRKKKQIVFLVVDGRQSHSRGYTMLETARKLRQHGAVDGLNLDGGGSTTLVVRRWGKVRIVNRPSDGAQRPVPNGLRIVRR